MGLVYDDGPTVLVINAGARNGREAAAGARVALGAHGVAIDEAYLVADPGRLAEALQRALARRPARIVVGGGDGSVSLAANLLAGTDVALGVLPLGTANDFARNLRLPRDVAAAAAVIATGETRRVTVGIANGRVFLNAVGFGVSSAIARRLTRGLKRRIGRLAQPAAAAEAFAPAPFRLTLDTGGRHLTLDALQVVVGNGRFHGGGALGAPVATIEDDQLDFYAVEAAPAGEGAERVRNASVIARLGMLLRKGRHLEHPGVIHLRCRELLLDAAPAQEVDADGERMGTTPVACRVAPRLLRVLAPASLRVPPPAPGPAPLPP